MYHLSEEQLPRTLTRSVSCNVAFPGFQCNHFGHQENCQNEEILNSLKYVCPGRGYQPTFTLTQKCEVNGKKMGHPVFAYLKDKLPYPFDELFSLLSNHKYITWSPVGWNFEKFLIGPEREPFHHYSRFKPSTSSLTSNVSQLPSRCGLLSKGFPTVSSPQVFFLRTQCTTLRRH